MNLILQNPLVGLLRTYGWALLLITVSLGIALGGFHALTVVGIVVGLLGGAWVGALAAGGSRVKRTRAAFEAERHAKGLLFVCPHCLIAETPTKACPGCHRPLPVEQIVTNGEIVRFCSECRSEVSPEAVATLPACCAACGRVDEGEGWMNQSARVVGTLSEADFNVAAALAGGNVQVDRGVRYVREAGAKEALFVLCLADVANSRVELPRRHAASQLTSIWVDQVDALAATEALDRLAQRSGLPAAALKRIELCAAVATLDPAAERAFTARLASPRYQVSAPSFLRREEAVAAALPIAASPKSEEAGP